VSDNRNDEWFAEWFDTPWYHVLYGNRSDDEAEAFVNRLYTSLAKYLNPSLNRLNS
jgi:hypothetical protein